MLQVCDARFDVTGNLKFFAKFFGTKQGPCRLDPMAKTYCHMDYGIPTCNKTLLRYVSYLKPTLGDHLWIVGSKGG